MVDRFARHATHHGGQRYLSVRVQDVPRAEIVATRLLECPICDTSYFYMETGPPRINMLSNPEAQKQIDAVRIAFYRVSKTFSGSGKLMRNTQKLLRHASKRHEPGKLDGWRREHAEIGCCRLRNTRATAPWTSASPAQLPLSAITLSPEDWLLYCVGSLRNGVRSEVVEGTPELEIPTQA